MYNMYVNILGVIQYMIYKLNEFVYLIKDKYTFKEQTFLDNNRLVYCLVAANGDVIHGLWQSFNRISKDEEDEVIKEYLKNKRRLVNFDYANAKPLIKLAGCKVGE